MKVVICGAGQVGFNIAKALARERNDVVVVDKSEDLIRKISDSLDVQAITGFASYPDVLERAGAGDADMLIAVTYADEVNMVACQVAGALFNVPKKIARVRNQTYLDPVYADIFTSNNLGIDVVISPEVEVAQAVRRGLRVPGAFDVIPLAEGQAQAVGVRCNQDCPVVDTPLRQLTSLFPELNIVITLVVRNGKGFVPSPDDHLIAGDDIYFVAPTAKVTRALAAFGHEEQEARRIVVVGGGNIGISLVRELENDLGGANIKLIEYDAERAKIVAGILKRTVVIQGDGLDTDILEEAGVKLAEAVVAVTNDDETNILASLLAKRIGANRAVTLVNKQVYEPLVPNLGIDTVISPRATTVSTILEHVRRGRIRGVHSLRNDCGEIIEGEALQTSGLIGKPLREIDLPDGSIIGAVVRDSDIVMPRGDTVIKLGDRVIIFALPSAIKKVERLFAVRLEYF
ncbi:MAG: trkA [Alphaproteobacteria bacterium]|jgi:trk system potassium uptake protein TrkA|nr:trkA [Alphaproteobacteria bacterium]